MLKLATVIEFDLPLLEEKAKSTLTPVVISNMDEIKELIKLSGSVTVGETGYPHQEVILARTEKWRLRAPFCLCQEDKLVVAFRLGIEHHVRHPIAGHANGICNGFPLYNSAHQL